MDARYPVRISIHTQFPTRLHNHVGAFTGADRKGRMGKFEIANGGTLFLHKTTAIPIQNHKAFNLSALEKETIGRALCHYNGNITQASKALGIGRNTLYDKIRKHGLKF